jgi:hypothetical protein
LEEIISLIGVIGALIAIAVQIWLSNRNFKKNHEPYIIFNNKIYKYEIDNLNNKKIKFMNLLLNDKEMPFKVKIINIGLGFAKDVKINFIYEFLIGDIAFFINSNSEKISVNILDEKIEINNFFADKIELSKLYDPKYILYFPSYKIDKKEYEFSIPEDIHFIIYILSNIMIKKQIKNIQFSIPIKIMYKNITNINKKKYFGLHCILTKPSKHFEKIDLFFYIEEYKKNINFERIKFTIKDNFNNQKIENYY